MSDTHDQPEAGQQGRRWTRKLGAAGAATAIIGAGVLAFAVSPTNANADPNDHNKYFVCKYVKTPGSTNEVLQTGQNPISVSGTAIAETPVVVGSFFNDKQGLSFVLSVDNTPPGPTGDPSVSDCPQVVTSTPPPPPPSSSSAGISASSSVVPSSSTVVVTVGVEPTSQGPVPGAVAAGHHTPVSSTTIELGGALMALGIAGLLGAVRPWKRGSH